MSQRNPSIDTLRLFAAFSVVTLHISHGYRLSAYVNSIRLLVGWAVPFFFIVGGYYLGKNRPTPHWLYRRSLRLTWIFLFTSALYLPVHFFRSQDTFALLESVFGPEFLIRGSYGHLWFISSMILGGLVITAFHEYRLTYLLYPLSTLLILLALLTDSYSFWNTPIAPVVPRHLLSIPLMFIGVVMSQRSAPRLSLSWTLVFLGLILQFAETHFLWRHPSYNSLSMHFVVGTLFTTVGIAYVGINSTKVLSLPFLANLGRHYALGIYLVHPAVILVVGKTAKLIQLSESTAYHALSPLVVLLVSIVALKFCARYLPSVYGLLNGYRPTAYRDRSPQPRA